MGVYLIGWDVGSWKCTGDSQDAVHVLEHECGVLRSVGQFEGNLLKGLADKPSLTSLLAAAKVALPLDANAILAIDAVFGWPTQFLDLIAGDASYMPDCEGRNTENRYLYRETERFLDLTFSMRSHPPMTAVGGAIGGAGTKAQWFVGHLRDGMNTYVPPLDPWDRAVATGAKLTIIEVYPAAANLSKAFKDLILPAGTRVGLLGKGDAEDALRSAMVAACYAQTIGLISNGFPEVYLPVGADVDQLNAARLSAEGWIFTPRK